MAWRHLACIVIALGHSGCHLFLEDADREVYRVIEQRQMAALGQTSEVRLDEDFSIAQPTSDPYAFIPHPVNPEIPESFRPVSADAMIDEAPPAPPTGGAGDVMDDAVADFSDSTPPDTVNPTAPQIEAPDDQDDEMYFGDAFTLHEALAYAARHAREYQTAKEDLYLQALALSLERFLWTPQFMSTLQATYSELPKLSDPDRAFRATAEVAVQQRLPYGGSVVAQWIGVMVGDLENHVTDSETGTAILEANIPLLRGAGKVAYESRYQSERDLIYAVRAYERFRRRFLTQIAAEYFLLLSTKASISNAIASREVSRYNWERSQALADAERIVRLEADRARVDFLDASNRVALAKEDYGTSLDEFKILIGMPTTTPIDAVDEGLDLADLDVDEGTAIDTATRMRLDLLNSLDRIDDARRNVAIARNNLLPDFDFTGRVTYITDPDHLNAFSFSEDREQWDATLDLEIPLNRKAERNAYRSSFIGLRRAERNYDLEVDRVRLEVRRAQRRMDQARFSLMIQAENIDSNEVRLEAAQIDFERGKISNRDLVDAQNDLRNARNAYANAQAELRGAILGFRLSTGTLRVDENGAWIDWVE